MFFSERSLTEGKTNEVQKTIEDLRKRGLIYEGRLPPPKGKLPGRLGGPRADSVPGD